MTVPGAVSTIEWVAAVLFGLAVLHTFSTKLFAKLAHGHSAHSGLWHWFAEIEVVFGVWALVLMLSLYALLGEQQAVAYLESRNFTEPLFVFAIMVVAASRPILLSVQYLLETATRFMPVNQGIAMYWLCLGILPLLGSFITEPAAMTLAALLLRDRFFTASVSSRFRYATLGVLFVNISIGGTLTNFAAPPVLMVAASWNWSSTFMLTQFGWKAALAVFVNASVLALWVRHELRDLKMPKNAEVPVPRLVSAIHVTFLVGVIVFAHHPPVFMGLLLFFIGYTEAYKQHQSPLILKEALLVAFFLAGLVVLGGLQQWWLQDTLLGVGSGALFFLATGLTAITDNAALTYLASLVEGTSAEFRYAIVAGAVTGGGLTVIANAPNPAGLSILKDRFTDGTVNPIKLLLAALPPTVIAGSAFMLL
ncbi:putative Na+/H+ antiporter [Limnobacter humi]|uniref:Na+/H+ antiporter n=1 Tax=Limnobacter humi TaxID=1778671 RepID=A0ABT1WFZ1_9BURK|nr:putative Na+/H+ antiporter [Limnobacter humi]MCQ8895823.1 putative Na+/H+ antiporter [Limnobacter humi]